MECVEPSKVCFIQSIPAPNVDSFQILQTNPSNLQILLLRMFKPSQVNTQNNWLSIKLLKAPKTGATARAVRWWSGGRGDGCGSLVVRGGRVALGGAASRWRR